MSYDVSLILAQFKADFHVSRLLQELKDVDISELIAAEKKLHNIIKSEFANYHRDYKQIFQQTYQGADKSSVEIHANSWLNDLAVEESLKSMVSQRSYLKASTIVVPVFSKYVLTYLSENMMVQTLLPNCKISLNAFVLHSQEKLLELFLEWSLENQAFTHISHLEVKQIIIPFLINEHYTVAVVKLSKSTYSKIAQIDFYNSYGHNLDERYIHALKQFFVKQGFIPRFDNISKLEQHDSYNCGLYVIHKAIETAANNLGKKERLLPESTNDHASYHTWSLNARSFIADLLSMKNINVQLTI